MTKLLGISGSLRRQSYNTALLKAAQKLVGADVELEIVTLHGIPLYDGDAEAAEGVPSTVVDLQARIAACDGLLLVTPEYNNSMPGVFKNALDWATRPPGVSEKVFRNRPVAVIGTSPGGFGTILAQNSWLPVLRALGTRQWFGGRLMVSHAGKVFDENGEMVDEAMREQLKSFMQGFVDFTKTA
ncbi:MAG: NADPH-dependent FMN reductase [Moraxellaceae bacterium]|nr:NADPH-dependent FMN reductase [Moraxellaceae bacterium]